MRSLRRFSLLTPLIPLLLLAAMTWPAESIAAQLTISWTDTSNNEDGFKIERKQGQTGTFTEIVAVGPNTTFYIDSGLAEGVTYCYQVRAYNISGDSPYSNEDCGTALTDTTPPVISGVSVNAISSSGATIIWTTNEPADSQIEFGPTVAYGSVTPLDSSLTSSHSQTLNGMSPSALYHYRVRSKDTAGNQTLSGDATFTTLAIQNFDLTVTRTGIGSGTVSSNPIGIDCGTDCIESYLDGTTVTLTALTDSGSLFGGWSGGGCSGTGPCTVSLTGDTSISAAFSDTSQAELPNLTQIHYRWRNDDGEEGDTSWWNTNWPNRRKMTFDNSASAEDLTDFPMLVSLTSAEIDYTKTQDAGQDIRFIDADGTTELAYEIEKWDESGTSVVWVKVPQIDAGSTTDHIWIYHNNSTAVDNQNAPGVWSNGYAGVWHLDQDPGPGGAGDMQDSSASGNNGTAAPSMSSADQVAGWMGSGMLFDGNDDYVEVGTSNWTVDQGTISLWANARGFPGTNYFLGHTTLPSFANRIQLYTDDAAGNLDLGLGSNHVQHLGIQDLDTDTWYFIVLIWDGLNYKVFVDGIEKATGTYSGLSNLNTYADIGNNGTSVMRTKTMDGIIDEVHVSDVARSTDWVTAQFKSMDGSFNTFGSEESQSAAATWAAAEDAILTGLAKNTLKRLRFEISNEGNGGATSTAYLLELSSPNPASCSAATYSAVPTDATGHWQIVDSVNLTDGVATTNVLSALTDENTTFVAGEAKDTGNQTAGISLSTMEFTEIEYALQATPNATDGALYCFRVTNAGSTADFTYTQYTQVTLGGVSNFLVETQGGGNISTQTAGVSFNIQITARDTLGNTVTSFNGTADITSSGNLSAGAGATTAFNNGVLTSHSLTITNTGTLTVTATETSSTASGTSNSFIANPGTATQLVLLTQPGDSTAGQLLTPQPVLGVVDAMGNMVNADPDTSVTETVTIAFLAGTNIEGSILSGVTTASIDWTTGQANFTDLAINLVGSYRFTATTSLGGFGTDSSDFSIKDAPASSATSLITAVPTSITADGTSTSTIMVQLRDGNGNNLTNGGDTVTLVTTLGTLGGVTDNGDGTYTSILTVATSSGTAIVTGTVNGQAITNNATVSFTPPPSGAHTRPRNH